MTTRLSIETEMGDNIDAISQKYHSLAQELGNVIPMGYHHIYRCQWLLHSTYWFVSQGKYMESWHVLSAAAREASELGRYYCLRQRMHRSNILVIGLAKDMESGRLPQFDREMRRRVWCVIQILDWLVIPFPISVFIVTAYTCQGKYLPGCHDLP